MNQTTWLQERRMEKFQDVLDRFEEKRLSAMGAAELLGMLEHSFRRYRHRFEEEGLEGPAAAMADNAVTDDSRYVMEARHGWVKVFSPHNFLDRTTGAAAPEP